MNVLERMSLPGSPRHLACVRIVLGLALVRAFTSPVVPFLQDIHAGIFPGSASVFPLAFELWVVPHLGVLLDVGLLASALMTVGLFTRVAVPLTLVCFLVTQNYYHRALMAHDDWMYYAFLLLVLCFARSHDALSIDAKLFKLKARALQSYRWPVELMITWFALLYTAAGLAKLFPLRKGLIWLEGASLQRMVMYAQLDSPLYWTLGELPFDYSQRWPFTLMAVASVTVELSAATLLFTRRFALWIILAVMAMHASIYVMGVAGFLMTVLPFAVVLIDPERLRE